MSHYECRHCGKYLCGGECQTPDRGIELGRLVGHAGHLEDPGVSASRHLLSTELRRMAALKDAAEILKQHGEYEDRFDEIFK